MTKREIFDNHLSDVFDGHEILSFTDEEFGNSYCLARCKTIFNNPNFVANYYKIISISHLGISDVGTFNLYGLAKLTYELLTGKVISTMSDVIHCVGNLVDSCLEN